MVSKSSFDPTKYNPTQQPAEDLPKGLLCNPIMQAIFLFTIYHLFFADMALFNVFWQNSFSQYYSPGYYNPAHIPFYEFGNQAALIPAVIFSLACACRIVAISGKYSSNLLCRVQVYIFALLAFLPLAIYGLAWLDGYVQNAGNVLHTVANLLSRNSFQYHGMEIVGQTGSLAFMGGFAVTIALMFKSLMFPLPYLRKVKKGLVTGTGSIWKKLIGERFIAWDEIESVKVIGMRKSKKQLQFKVQNGPTYAFSWDDLQKFLNPAELMNDLKTFAPDAVDHTCVIKNDDSINSHEYTELWLKYFTSGSARNRSGALTAGERLHEGRYEIAGELGQGGQGTAYLASISAPDAAGQDAGITIVLKEYILPVHRGEAILQQSMKKLHHEAEILAKIDHPNIVALKDTFVEDHRGYLVLEFVDGHVLKQMVQNQGPQLEHLVIDIALQACDAIEHLHNMDPPIIHRDITPDNLILQPDGRVKLVDFNVAQQLEPTATATVVGKHAYIPPEQFRGKPTRQSDIFALGGTMFYLLTGKEPEPLSVSHPCTINESVSDGLDAIVAKSTALDQNYRFANANELRQALLSLSGKRITVVTRADEPIKEQA